MSSFACGLNLTPEPRKLGCCSVGLILVNRPFLGKRIQSTVRKKMTAVHFSTIPCEPNMGSEKAIFFAKFVPVSTTLCMQG